MSNMKTILSVLVAMLMLSGIAMAGNLQAIGVTSEAVNTLAVNTATITSPATNDRLMNENLNLVYTRTGTDPLTYVVDAAEPVALGDSPQALGNLAEGEHTVKIMDGLTELASVTFIVDRTAPGNVTGLSATDKTTDSITWSWTNPADADFKNVRVTVKTGETVVAGYDGLVLSDGLSTVTVTGLSSNTPYTITVQTEDNATLQ